MMDGDSTKRRRKASGPERPVYFNQGDIDRVMAIVLALMSEVAAIRNRLDTHERLADAGERSSHAAVEAYLPDADAESSREAWRDAFIRRLFRVITEDVEALGGKEPKA